MKAFEIHKIEDEIRIVNAKAGRREVNAKTDKIETQQDYCRNADSIDRAKPWMPFPEDEVRAAGTKWPQVFASAVMNAAGR